MVSAQVSKTINIATAGTLTTLLTATEKTTVTGLTITGSINEDDFYCMREEMPAIANLDLTGASIAAYNGMFYTSPANELPRMAFSFISTKKYSNLKTIKLPVNLISIGENAFNSCIGLNSVTIPASCTTIKNGAFWACTALQTITIPTSVTVIEDDAFNGCTSMNSIYVNNPVPVSFAANATTFQGINTSTCVLYIPSSAITAYRQADKWNEFINIVGLTTDFSPTESEMTTIEYKNGSVKVLNPAENELLEVFDVSGRKIRVVSIRNEDKIIDMQLLNAGIYVIKLAKSGELLKILMP